MPTRLCRCRLLAALLLTFVGCAGSSGNVDLLEARLRDQQDLAARYERLADTTQQQLATARQESELLRTQLAQAGASPLLPEHADVLLRAEKLQFHQLMTGARNIDAAAGDDVLNVVITPQARDGETIHLVGDLEIEALDLSRPEGQQQIGCWTYTAEQARELWHAGFLASGFQMDLAWDTRPQSPDVLLHARLKTADGRQLDTTHQIQVDLPVTAAALTTDAPRIEPQRIEAAMPVKPLIATGQPSQPAVEFEPPAAPSPSAELATAPPLDAVGRPSPAGDVAPFPLIEPSPAEVASAAEPVPAAIVPSDSAPAPAFPETAPPAAVPPPVDLPQVAAVLPEEAAPLDATPAGEIAAPPPTAALPQIAPQVSSPPAVNAESTGRATVQMGVSIEPLPTPQRFRRMGRAEVPPTADIPSVTHPQPVAPAPPATSPAAPPAPQPFPVDVTSTIPIDVTQPDPPSTVVTPTSVRWTDDSIPYLR